MTGPVFILSAPRSGSTLLSSLICAHPSLTNVGEVNFANVLLSMHASEILIRDLSRDEQSAEAENPSLDTLVELRNLAQKFYSMAVSSEGPTGRFCDKSLTNVFGPQLLYKVWADAQFVVIHRHCADFIQSCLHSTPWGASGYGFEPYTASSPGNSVLALTRMWIDRIQQIRSFAGKYPKLCHAVRYEDLVAGPGPEVARVWEFLGLQPLGEEIEALYEPTHVPATPKDHKIRHSPAIHDGSVGKGFRIPVEELLPRDLLAVLNLELTRLGYVPVGQDWGSFRDELTVGSFASVVAAELPLDWHDRDRRESKGGPASVQDQEVEATTSEDANLSVSESVTASPSVSIEVLLLDGRRLEFRGLANLNQGTIESSDLPTETTVGTLVISLETLSATTAGYIDFGDAYRRGDYRYYARGTDGSLRRVDDTDPVVQEIGDLVLKVAHAPEIVAEVDRFRHDPGSLDGAAPSLVDTETRGPLLGSSAHRS